MPSKLSRWLSGYKPSNPEFLEDFVSWMYSNARLIDDIEEALEKLTSNTVSDICQRLFVFYKSGESDLQRFTIILLPSLIYFYLYHSYKDNWLFQNRKVGPNFNDVSQNSMFSSLGLLESCLVGICSHYLLTVSSKTDSESLMDFRNICLPSLNSPSVYHDPVSLKDCIDQNDVNLKDQNELSFNQRIPTVICLIQNYLDMLYVTDFVYPLNKCILYRSLSRFSKLCNRICNLSQRPRIPVSANLLTVLINCCDLILFKLDLLCSRFVDDFSIKLIQTICKTILFNLEQINERSTYHCFSSCMLLCNSLLHYRTNNNSLIILNKTTKLMLETCNKLDVNFSGIDPNQTEVFTNASFRSETMAPDISPPSLNDEKNDDLKNNSVKILMKTKLKSKINGNIRSTQNFIGVDHRLRKVEQRNSNSNTDLAGLSSKDL